MIGLQGTIGYPEVCKILGGCSRFTVDKLKDAGELPFIKHAGKNRFYIDGVEAYLERQKAVAFEQAAKTRGEKR